MLNAEELRLGNKIKANGLLAGAEVTVEQIGARGTMNEEFRVILFKETTVGEFIKDCGGIILTTEWLIKTPFREVTCNVALTRWTTDKYLIEKSFSSPSWSLRYRTGEKRSKLITDFLYVHTLQNLFFPLTGKELLAEKIG